MAAHLDLDAPDVSSTWAASGAMALTGRPEGPPLGPPAGLVPGLLTLADRLGAIVELDPVALLGERAALAGLTRGGDRSCGGGARLLRARSGWVAVALARPDDVDLLPAWLEITPATSGPPGSPAADEDVWEAVAAALAQRDADVVVDRGIELGLPVAAVDEPTSSVAPTGPPLGVEVIGPGAPRALAGAVVADLSSLWAGPLCGSLLGAGGATVIKVESSTRPDGARRGDVGFYDLLNAGKRSVALDLASLEGRKRLHQLVAGADVVIEGTRPRALEQLGLDARTLLATGRPKVWVSITGHGRSDAAAMRVGFGDDAAAAGGLLVWDEDGPCFCADAVADPLTGLAAAAEVLDALASEGTCLLDVGMARVARSFGGPTLAVAAGAGEVAAPRARSCSGRAAELGADTAAVLQELGGR